MATRNWVNIGSGNSLLLDGTKPLLEQMCTYHQWGPVTITWWQISQEKPQPSTIKISFKTRYLKFPSNFPVANELTYEMRLYWGLSCSKYLIRFSSAKFCGTQWGPFQCSHMVQWPQVKYTNRANSIGCLITVWTRCHVEASFITCKVCTKHHQHGMSAAHVITGNQSQHSKPPVGTRVLFGFWKGVCTQWLWFQLYCSIPVWDDIWPHDMVTIFWPQLKYFEPSVIIDDKFLFVFHIYLIGYIIIKTTY